MVENTVDGDGGGISAGKAEEEIVSSILPLSLSGRLATTYMELCDSTQMC